MKNIEERVAHIIPETIPTVWRCLWEPIICFSYKKRSGMVMNTRSGSQINQQAKVLLEPVIQNNSQPPSFPTLGDGDKDRIAADECQILHMWSS
jgi:hypothetical protein